MPSLTVERQTLLKALQVLKKSATPQKDEKALLGFADGMLIINVTGMRASIAAEGEWPGEARVDAAMLLRMSRAVPPGDPVIISIADGTLAINTFHIACAWQDAGWRVPFLPRNPTLLDLLRLPYDAFPQEIEASGLGEAVQNAVKERNKRINQALAILSPLGVTLEDLLSIIENCIVRDDK